VIAHEEKAPFADHRSFRSGRPGGRAWGKKPRHPSGRPAPTRRRAPTAGAPKRRFRRPFHGKRRFPPGRWALGRKRSIRRIPPLARGAGGEKDRPLPELKDKRRSRSSRRHGPRVVSQGPRKSSQATIRVRPATAAWTRAVCSPASSPPPRAATVFQGDGFAGEYLFNRQGVAGEDVESNSTRLPSARSWA
jgi:hypothetical protein